MTRGKAVLAGFLFPAIMAAVLYALFLPHPRSGGVTFSAEFQDIDQLVPGHDVVEGGTRVGVVDKVKLTDRGTVLVTATLDRGVPRPRQDAAASVRVADLLGNVYLSLSPGHASAPLTRAIAPSRTFVATQLQDLLNSFAEPTRSALQAILVELGTALDARGDDLNGAVLRLAPLLDEITRVSNQVGSQNAQLGRLVSSGAALAAQIAPRSRDLERLINGLDWTTSITSARAASLDRGIARLPRTLRQTRRTLARVQQVAVAATPLAGDLAATAPQLTSAVVQLRPFTRTAAPALARLGLLTRNLTATLSRGGRSLARLRRSFAALAGVAPPVRDLAAVLDPLVPFAIKGVLGGLGGLAAEPSDQNPGRNFFRGEAVLGCENFGVPTHPGCLTEVVSSLVAKDRSAVRAAAHRVRPPSRPAAPSTPAPSVRVPPVPPAAGGAPAAGATTTAQDSVKQLLDFLLGP